MLFVERYKIENMVFAPTATDIMQHIPGWVLGHFKGKWICWFSADEFGYPDFASSNPSEACAQAFLFQKEKQKNVCT